MPVTGKSCATRLQPSVCLPSTLPGPVPRSLSPRCRASRRTTRLFPSSPPPAHRRRPNRKKNIPTHSPNHAAANGTIFNGVPLLKGKVQFSECRTPTPPARCEEARSRGAGRAPGLDASGDCPPPTHRREEGRSRGYGRAPGLEASEGCRTATQRLGEGRSRGSGCGDVLLASGGCRKATQRLGEGRSRGPGCGDVLPASEGSFPTSRTDTHISYFQKPHCAGTCGNSCNPMRSPRVSLPKFGIYDGKENKIFFSTTIVFSENRGTQFCRP